MCEIFIRHFFQKKSEKIWGKNPEDSQVHVIPIKCLGRSILTLKKKSLKLSSWFPSFVCIVPPY